MEILAVESVAVAEAISEENIREIGFSYFGIFFAILMICIFRMGMQQLIQCVRSVLRWVTKVAIYDSEY